MSVILRFHWRISIATAFTLLALVLSLVFALSSRALTFAAVTLLQLSSDPFTNSTSQHKTEVEPDTFASGSTIVSAFQVGRFFNGGASDIGFATSTDGGKKFTSGFLPFATVNSTPAGTYGRASDPSVAFDVKHNVWMISWLGFTVPGSAPVDVLVSRSTDGGLTWSTPVVVNNDGEFNDKNWTVCDNTVTSPFNGNCYTEFDDASKDDLIQMSTSTDGGLTWGAAQTTASHDHAIGGQPLVQPGGTVIVPIEGFASRNGTILSFISTDGGASWSKAVIVAKVAFHHPAGGIRASVLPSAEIDGSGKVYVVWPDCHFESDCTANDLVLSTSTDGINWSAVTRIPLNPIGSGVDHFIPGLAVDKSTSDGTAHLVLTFYFYPVANCTTSTCQLDVGFSTSADGGASWTANTKIAGPMSLTWLPNTTQGRMVGDYISTSFTGSPAFPAFAVASAPTSGGSDCFTATPNCNEAIFTVQDGLSVGGSANPASDQTNASSNDTLTGSSLTAQ